MKTVWLIEFVAETPPIYLAEGGWITYRATKAKRYESRAEAEKRFKTLKLPDSWAVVAHNLSEI